MTLNWSTRDQFKHKERSFLLFFSHRNKLQQTHKNTFTHFWPCYTFGTYLILSSRETHKLLNPQIDTNTVLSEPWGDDCADKVDSLSDSPAAPSISNKKKIAMPDLFDMKRWEGSITAGNVPWRWASSVGDRKKREWGCVMCFTDTR